MGRHPVSGTCRAGARDPIPASRSRPSGPAGTAGGRQDLAAGLARRAVRDLVRLVAHAAQVVAAPRARLPVLAVHREVVADLGGEAAGPRAARPRARPPCTARVASSSRVRSSASSLPSDRVRRQLARDAGCRRCSRVRRRPPCAGRAGSCARGARRRSRAPTSANSVRQHLGPELRERPVVAGGEHPPARPCAPSRTPSRARSAGRSRGTAGRSRAASWTSAATPRRRARPARGGTAARQPPSSSTTTNLPRCPTRSIVRPRSSSGRGAYVFSDENCSMSSAWSVAPRERRRRAARPAPGPPASPARAHAPASSRARVRHDVDALVDPVAVRPVAAGCRRAGSYSPWIKVLDRNTRFDALITSRNRRFVGVVGVARGGTARR